MIGWDACRALVVVQDGVSPLLFAEAQTTVVKLYAHFRVRERGIMEYRSTDKWLPCCRLPLSLIVHSPSVGERGIDTTAQHGL
jgi:hypothetical protein